MTITETILQKTEGGRTALHLAGDDCNWEIVKLLIEKGANIETQGTYGQTALHAASSRGDLEIIKLLIENGANIEAQDKYSSTALHWAVNSHCSFVSSDCLEVVKFLIKKGAKVEAKNNKNETPFYIAKKKSNKKLIELFEPK